MVRIVSDTATMYSSAEARKAGFSVSPVCVTINNKSYKELDEISAEEFTAMINEGHMPQSSQPSIGDVIDLYQEFEGDKIINIAMADGLSGTYSSAVAAARSCKNEQDITVVNCRTICGPQRYIVEKAVQLAAAGFGVKEILEKLEQPIKNNISFLIPLDFDYLRRGGRLSPLVSLVGKTIKLAPVLTQSADRRQIVMASVKRSFKQAIQHVKKEFEALGVGAGWRVYVTHGNAPEKAEMIRNMLKEQFADIALEIFPLTPAFIAQAGPGSVAVQAVKEL